MLKSGPGTEESFAPFSERSRKPEQQHELQLELDSGCVLLRSCCWCIRFKTRPFVNWFRVVLAKTQIRKLFWEASTSVGSDAAASTTNQTTGQTVLQDQPRRPFSTKHRRRVVYFALHQLHLSRDVNVDCAVAVTVAVAASAVDWPKRINKHASTSTSLSSSPAKLSSLFDFGFASSSASASASSSALASASASALTLALVTAASSACPCPCPNRLTFHRNMLLTNWLTNWLTGRTDKRTWGRTGVDWTTARLDWPWSCLPGIIEYSKPETILKLQQNDRITYT